MSQHTPSPSRRQNNRRLPLGRCKLQALEVALDLAAAISRIRFPRGTAHLRDHLTRAADNPPGRVAGRERGGRRVCDGRRVENTVLRLSEVGGRTLGNRYQHLEAAYAENQEAQSDLQLLRCRRVGFPSNVIKQAERLGGLIYGLLRAEGRAR